VKAYIDSPLFRGITTLELDVTWGCGDWPVTACSVDRGESGIDVVDVVLADESAFPSLQRLRVKFTADEKWNPGRFDVPGAEEAASKAEERIEREGREAFSKTRARGVDIVS
jgi:hypothetical protein